MSSAEVVSLKTTSPAAAATASAACWSLDAASTDGEPRSLLRGDYRLCGDGSGQGRPVFGGRRLRATQPVDAGRPGSGKPRSKPPDTGSILRETRASNELSAASR